MDIALTVICVLGILLFGLYLFVMIKTSMDDVKAKKLEKLEMEQQLNKNGKA